MISSIKKYLPANSARQLKKIWQNIQRVYYAGDTYYCPFCGHTYRKFRPGGFDLPVNHELQIIGSGYRENMLCPGCYSTDRDRLLFLFLQNQTRLFSEPIRMLHIAPSGALSRFLTGQKNIHYIIGTKYHEGIYYPGNIDLIDITSLKYEDESFDVILCNHVLEHVQEDIQAMKELYRVLKPSGWAILQVPVSMKLVKTFENPKITEPAEREKHFGQFDHVRIYGNDYPDRLEKVGFKVEKHNLFTGNYKIDHIEKYSLNKAEVIFLAKKQVYE